MKNYNNLDLVLKNLNTSLNGLDEEEVKKRINSYGKNELPRKKKKSIIKIFLNQILDPIVILLIITACISFLLNEIYDSFVVIFIILIDLIMGTFQENNALKKADSLENIIKVKCKVLRDNKEIIVDSSNLVIGDIVYLESGNKVSADMLIIDSYNLTVDESILTGESLSVYKSFDCKNNLLYAGSVILTGRCKCVVIKTGINTEIGQIAKYVSNVKEEKSPLTIRIEKFSKQISFIIIIIAILLTVLLLLKGNNFTDVFISVIALLISALPEGLPLALTMALTVASNRMLNKNVIVKKLNSVESLGSCTLIASDKTGTLTLNFQTAKVIMLPNAKKFEITGNGYDLNGKVIINLESDKEYIDDLIKLSYINNEASITTSDLGNEYLGDSIDIALLVLSLKMNISISDITIISSIPYEPVNNYSAIFYKVKNDKNIYCTVKGSCEKILDFSSKMLINSKTEKIDNNLIKSQNEELANLGYRVISFANGIVSLKEEYTESDIKNLTFKGLIGFIDPIRDDCYESVSKCLNASLKVVMITGDHPLTAYKIAESLGIIKTKKEIATSKEIEEKLNEGYLVFDEFIKNKKVFARITPIQKLEIVNSFKRQGEYVAVSGDGVNDAPALKAANIGISMGSGTNVAIENSKMILVDDNFSSIVAGIIEGRCAYSNIRKIIYLLISCGLAEVLFFVLAIFFNLPIPLIAIQLLWLNLVTDGLQDLALSYEKPEDDILNKNISPKDNLFDKTLINEILISGISIGVIVFLVWGYLIKILNFDITLARTYVMTLMVFIQNIHVLNCRSENKSIFDKRIKSNKFIYFSIILSLVLQILVIYIPFFSSILKVKKIPIFHLLILFLISLSILFIMELVKMYKSKENL